MSLHGVSEAAIDKLRAAFPYQPGRPAGADGYSDSWYAGDQVNVLRAYLRAPFRVVASDLLGSYSGEAVAAIEDTETGAVYLWVDYFGSCSGCDGLDGASWEDGWTQIMATLTAGDLQVFPDRSTAEAWLVRRRQPDEPYQWDDEVRQGLLNAMRKAASR